VHLASYPQARALHMPPEARTLPLLVTPIRVSERAYRAFDHAVLTTRPADQRLAMPGQDN
jgi:hypothetical protein